MSPRAVQHFIGNGRNDIITGAVNRAAISTFEQHNCLTILPRYLRVLQEHDIQRLSRQLVRDRYELQAPYDLIKPLPEGLQMHDRVLEILQYLNDDITLQTGERMLEASKVLRQEQAAEFGDLCDAGRKVDLAFLHKGIELSNIEFKKPGIGAMDITVQCRKNIRLGRCLQEQHRRYGVQEPSVIMGNVAGLCKGN
ncbi:hypothetical protein BGZ73_000207 [Actinomortierella ambigua]|nr:hypothetical protein BGZ73_000207 [Actinomortierella ambigua]